MAARQNGSRRRKHQTGGSAEKRHAQRRMTSPGRPTTAKNAERWSVATEEKTLTSRAVDTGGPAVRVCRWSEPRSVQCAPVHPKSHTAQHTTPETISLRDMLQTGIDLTYRSERCRRSGRCRSSRTGPCTCARS